MKFIIVILLAFLAFATARVTFESSTSDCDFTLDADKCKPIQCAIPPSAIKLIGNKKYESGYAYLAGNTCSSLIQKEIEIICNHSIAIPSDGKNTFTAMCYDFDSSSSSTLYLMEYSSYFIYGDYTVFIPIQYTEENIGNIFTFRITDFWFFFEEIKCYTYLNLLYFYKKITQQIPYLFLLLEFIRPS
ncbi:hypothetical protein DICPUDRAFT_82869 [Dictyostelium purpureum]|uniref:Uncharacterized protein n=1 Tax=Dictyostelium purpureum TaxID=5786 RepID=F0ZXV8_DICPU|nr:uncharacterized protein DICPUDRAFT_82869 [Dictyostelium purpureum]EGC31225.1 hypothetical protein DICPUDRAFT_82869 [Dictyostelium purpureum]|eukprot:XP_003292255.1 hypothetical protein DICPUDRAFT_82869 [Dictyostelium purpureum]